MEELVSAVSAAISALPAGESTLRLYRREPTVPQAVLASIAAALASTGQKESDVSMEAAFNVEWSAKPADAGRAAAVVCFLVAETFAPGDVSLTSFLIGANVLELGPRRTFATAFSSTASAMCAKCGVAGVARLERSRRYAIVAESNEKVLEVLHDRMTECVWSDEQEASSMPKKRKRDGGAGLVPHGDLRAANAEFSLGFDDFDCDYYASIFGERLKRDPTHAELYDMSQSNSEHSRHWFFSGRQVIDGVEKEATLFQLVKETLKLAKNKDVSVIAFADNSSAIQGGDAMRLAPSVVGEASAMRLEKSSLLGVLTAETHNFPCAVAPFPGAETGAGGRMRDNQATGRGAHIVAGIAGYCVGNLKLDGVAGAENDDWAYPSHLASPLRILLEASDGASDYGNKFGEPLIIGYCRSYGGLVAEERYEFVKPVMFSAGVGLMHEDHVKKRDAAPGMLVAKIGGPCYPVGMGGGAASSRVAIAANASLDFDAVQRGDAQMLNRMNRVVRACCELGDRNPIASIHDQGCGGNANVLKEIVEGAGAEYKLSKFTLGDKTMTGLEIWGAEYQESNALLLEAKDEPLLRRICERENCQLDIVGEVARDHKSVRVIDDRNGSSDLLSDLPLDLVMEKLPPKTFKSDTRTRVILPFSRESPLLKEPRQALKAVLSLPRVCSKRFLVHKVDRSVGGLVARQQCVGPLQLPLSNCAVIARSHLSTEGVAVSIGEAPQLTNLSPSRMARCSVAEMLTNLCFASITCREDIRLSANWMWAAKLAGEGAKMYDACESMSKALIEVGVAVDGGKDSLSMAAPDGLGGTVKAPGALTLTAYATCADISATLTPDLKFDAGALVLIDLGAAHDLGGSSLAQAMGQLGASEAPDADLPAVCAAFDAVQALIVKKHVIGAGHDRSDGGLIVTLLEMAFAGYRGFSVDIPSCSSSTNGDNALMRALFNEAPGLVLEVKAGEADGLLASLRSTSALKDRCFLLGSTTKERRCVAKFDGAVVIDDLATTLWMEWEATSFALERRQRDSACADAEFAGIALRKPPKYHLTYEPSPYVSSMLTQRHKVAVVRCQGSNGDREMAAAFHVAGLEAWDVTMEDLACGKITLDGFRGAAFVGGFSYADVFDSAKGWAATIHYDEKLRPQFENFRERTDTFSLGVCNGCQLLALLGWVAPASSSGSKEAMPRFIHNTSGKFESRWLSVKVLPSPAVMLKGMAGSTLGVWVAHGEGKLHCPTEETKKAVFDNNLAPMRYADDDANPTSEYPFCPNGSLNGAAALCSADGRHLAMMPHPERCLAPWQQPYAPAATLDGASPWLRLFENARLWLDASP